MSVSERVSYLRGLSQGLGIAEDEKMGKFYTSLLETLEEISDAIDALDDDYLELEDYIDSVDEDLVDLEQVVYHSLDEDEDDLLDFDPTGDYHEKECPSCGETIAYFDEVYDDETEVDILCPNCEATVTTLHAELEEDLTI